MSEIADVVASAIATSAWANQIKDRTVMRYATAIARDASVPSPVQGDLAFLQDTDQVTFYTGAAWVDVIDETGFASGTEAAPGIPFIVDPDTGVFRISSNTLGLTTGGTERAQIDSNGVEVAQGVGINTSASVDPRLKVLANSGEEAFRFKRNTATADVTLGTIRSNVGGADTDTAFVQADGDWFNINGTYGTISDERLKENIQPADSYLEKLLNLELINYNLIGHDQKLLGVSAQQTQTVIPGIVKEGEDGMLSVKSSVLIYMLLGAVQELSDRVTELES